MASKIGKAEWVGLYVVAGVIDVLQFFGDLFLTEAFAAPEIINGTADPLIGTLIGGYLQFRGADIIHKPKRIVSLVGIAGLEELTGGIAPGWIFDIWYIHSDVRKEEAGIQVAKEQAEWLQSSIQKSYYENGVGRVRSEEREEQEPMEFNRDGYGRPRGDMDLAA